MTLFGAVPAGGAVAILGLLCFERDLRAVWPVLALNIAVTLAIPTRSVWLGLAVGGLVWGILTGRIGRIIVIGHGRSCGRRRCSNSRACRFGSALASARSWAASLRRSTPSSPRNGSPDAKIYADTVEWRQKWWHSDLAVRAFGTDARGVRPWLRFRPVRVGPGRRARGAAGGDPNPAQRLLLRARLHGMGRGRPVRHSAIRHSQAALAILSAHRDSRPGWSGGSQGWRWPCSKRASTPRTRRFPSTC